MTDSVNISEIFTSIQGEGPGTGLPTTFVRFQGCSRDEPCTYCDTLYAFKPEDTLYGGKVYGVGDVVAEVVNLSSRCGIKRVCITGGEPLAQENALKRLVLYLNGAGFFIEVETNGLERIPFGFNHSVDCWLCDYKLPSSGAVLLSERLRQYGRLRKQDALMCIAGTSEDLDCVLHMIRIIQPRCQIYINPIWGQMELKTLAEWILNNQHTFHAHEANVRLGMQLHKYTWGSNQRGV